jgi:hypothetical protein
MALKISKALSGFDMAEFVDLNCGDFEIRIVQAAIHNEKFRAAITKRSLAAKKKSLVPDQGTMTGSLEEDVNLFIENVILGWSDDKPLIDDDGKEVPATPDNLRELFLGSREGKVLFGKVQAAAVDDSLFLISEEDKGNS